MRKQAGFSLIELIVFIIITSILASAILFSYVSALGKSPTLLQNTIATQTARQCAEWYLGQRRVNGYSSVSGTNCTSSLTLPSFCTVPSGYTLAATCSQTTVRSDTKYETITLTVSGAGSAALTLLLGDY
jgi:prepilin-type N-terminal cleavage/methylation domain-containing protein